MKRRKGCCPFKSPRSYLRQRGNALRQCGELQQQWLPASLSAPLLPEAAVRVEIPDIWKTGSFLLTLAPTVCKLLQEHMPSCLPGDKRDEEWVTAIVPRAEIEHKVYCPSLPLEVVSLQQTPEFQNTSDRFCQYSCCSDLELYMRCCLLHHLPRNLSISILKLKNKKPKKPKNCQQAKLDIVMVFLLFFICNFITILIKILTAFFFFNFYALFIYFWLCWVFVSVCGLSLVAASGGRSSSPCAGLSLSRPLLLRSTGSKRAGSVLVAHGPSCPAACGIFADQGSNPCPLHWQADSQPLRHQGSPLTAFYVKLEKLIPKFI